MILCIGDPHFKSNNKLETELLLLNILTILHTRTIDFVVILGDVLDNHEKIDMKCFIRMTNFIDKISELKQVYILVGNHDRSNNKVFLTDEHIFTPFKRWNNVYIVDDHCKTIEWEGKKICMVPYVPNGMFMSALKRFDLNPKDFDLFFSHQEFAGCSINKISGAKCDVWEPDYPMNVAGHIHNFEILNDNLVYVGTPFQHSFGESAENRGVWLINTDLELEIVELDIPKKITLRIDYTEISTVVIEPNQKTRLIITGPKSIIKEVLQNDVYKEKFKGVKIVFDNKNKKKKTKIEFRSNMAFIDRLSNGLDANTEIKSKFQRFFSKT